MSQKNQYVKITRPDRTIHFSPITNLAKLTFQNTLKKPEEKYRLESISLTDEELAEHPTKDNSYSSPKANNELALAQKLAVSKDKEIEALKAKLAAFESGSVTKAPAAEEAKTPISHKAEEVVKLIEAASTIEEVEALIFDDTRVTVIKAAEKRKSELSL